MQTSPVTLHRNLVVLAQMLERLERSAAPVDAHQYHAVVERLTAELQATHHDAALEVLLATFPSVAELYENLNYQVAGLCRSPIEPAAAAEIAARDAIEHARRMAPRG